MVRKHFTSLKKLGFSVGRLPLRRSFQTLATDTYTYRYLFTCRANRQLSRSSSLGWNLLASFGCLVHTHAYHGFQDLPAMELVQLSRRFSGLVGPGRLCVPSLGDQCDSGFAGVSHLHGLA